jgi:2-polyprenyl-3-methyl-5-hydroxy-6-metoxy-1,4-benzoquinol methylase
MEHEQMNGQSTVNGDLAGPEYWRKFWSGSDQADVRFDPESRNLRDLHSLFRRWLPSAPGKKFIELGCHPGRFLWYFATYFGCRVSGVDYIESLCRTTEYNLADHGIQADIIHANLLDFNVEPDASWDIVASFGLLEHFDVGAGIIRKHFELAVPGGIVVITVPNLQGIYGNILRILEPDAFAAHRIISLEQLKVETETSTKCEILEAGYFGRLGFGHTGLREAAGRLVWPFGYFARAALYAVEKMAQYLLKPSAALSPYIAVLARKPRD